mgnify:FL=1
MKKYYSSIGLACLITCLIMLLFTISVNSAESVFTKVDENNNLRLGNEYVVVVVNQNQNAMGRFAIETTGGAPFKDSDDNKPLVYGRPKPWTSYTTINIDGKNYVFGGKTKRRAGKDDLYGEVIQPPMVKDNSIITTTDINNVKIEQILKIVKSSTTGLYDSVQIKYRIKNKSNNSKEIGLRVMLDTMLGKNDGAPFRLGKRAITTDKLFLKNELPNFWQAFDSISSPKVTSQGNFQGIGVTVPDKVYFSDWGSMADGSWQFDFNPGEEFIRKGEYETDSAIALYWQPDKLGPGESKTYITNYGLGGITIVPGLISMGVTSPAEVTLDKRNKTFPIIAYIENTSEIEAKNVRINLDLPEEFTTESTAKSLGNLKSGDIRQIVWQVTPTADDIPENIKYEVVVEADNTDSNKVIRNVKFVGPPGLQTKVDLEDKLSIKLGRIKPNPFTIQAKIKNEGDSILFDTYSELILPPGITLAPKEASRKYLSYLKPGEEVKVNWEVKSLNVEGGFQFAVKTEGLHGYSKTVKKQIKLPGLEPLLYLKSEKEEFQKGEYVTVDLRGENLSNIKRMDLKVGYDSDYLKPIYVYPGNIFVKNNKVINWNDPDLSKNGMINIQEILPENIHRGTVARIQFKVIKSGKPSLSWHQVIGENKEDKTIEFKTIKGVIKNEENF